MSTIFFQAFVYLFAALITVPIFKRIGFGSVLGYLFAGIIIGPYVLNLIHGNTHNVMNFAEFGVVMMLFLIGLELRPQMLWELRIPLLLIGGLQVIITIFALGIAAYSFGIQSTTALAIGMIFTSSSTAIVLQMLNEKGWIKLDAGNTIFAVLLFQDIAVIPMLAIFPLLANHPITNSHSNLSGWHQTIIIVLLISLIIFAGNFLMRPVFRFIANARIREAFTALALILVIGTALAMQYVGLSPALGAFLAGAVLAENEYRHQLEADIEPFKGLLLGLFFISVGANIDFILIANHLMLIISMVILLMIVKFIIVFGLALIFKKNLRESLLIGITLAQGGEFCFVLISYARDQNLLNSLLSHQLIAVVALSMLLTPFIILIYDKIIEPWLSKKTTDQKSDITQQTNSIIIIGFGRFGQVISRFMLANGITGTVLDIDPNQVETMRQFGFKVFYGDGARLDLLQTAGISNAKLLIIAIDNTDSATAIVKIVKLHYPNVKILLRVRGRIQTYEALNLGLELNEIYRETLGSSLDMANAAIQTLGFGSDKAKRAINKFKKFDEDNLLKLAKLYNENHGLRNDDYLSQIKQINKELFNVLSSDKDE